MFSPCAGCGLCIFAFVLDRKTGLWKGKVIQKFIVEPPLVFVGTFSRPLRSWISLVYLDVTGSETNLPRIKMVVGSLLKLIYFQKKKNKAVITPRADHNCNHRKAYSSLTNCYSMILFSLLYFNQTFLAGQGS